MANLGIVIAVSEYEGTLIDLPGCKRDGVAVASLLRASGKFDDILVLQDRTASSNVKQQLADFISKNRDNNIEEVFFYFSGHGTMRGNDFYYLLTDFSENKMKSTSLENSELDNMIRSLAPSLFVKIVDACNSGVTYIKRSDEISSILKGTESQFRNVYFLFSSQSDQSSYADSEISFFTRSILKSVLDHPGGSIRYKDIIDYVSDSFSSASVQTPQFVIQASFTEIFCEISEVMRADIRTIVEPSDSIKTGELKQNSLLQVIMADSDRYCDFTTATNRVNEILVYTQKYTLRDPLDRLFDIFVDTEQKSVPNSPSIGAWIQKNKDKSKILAQEMTTLKQTAQSKSTSPIMAPSTKWLTALTAITQKDLDIEYESVISGFQSTVELPYHNIRIYLKPKFPNITPEECYIVPLISRTQIHFFWAFCEHEFVDWENSRRIGVVRWTTATVNLIDASAVEAQTAKILSNFENSVEGSLSRKWLPPPADEAPSGLDSQSTNDERQS